MSPTARRSSASSRASRRASRCTTSDIQDALARRRLGYGRGARMKFEQDEVRLLGGRAARRHAGRPGRDRDRQHRVAQVGRRDVGGPGRRTPTCCSARAQRPADPSAARARRPGRHAQVRRSTTPGPVLERASARETATRVALGTVAARFLEQAAGVRLVVARRRASGRSSRPDDAALPTPDDARRARRRPGALLRRRRPRPRWSRRSTSATRTATRSAASSRCSPTGCRPGSARYVHCDRRLDARLAARAHGHPGDQGRRGRGRLPHRRPTRLAGARRDRAGRRPGGSCGAPTAPAASRAA